ncbi:pentapeptide repeat-containing protein [Amorphus sp. 3PC139-8]|uniref:pentapeptide repeat-containing protein n=1 Tax=Amorphus sp. 3PC139-8 TaxID=2735676 RepID=UPI00345DCD42
MTITMPLAEDDRLRDVLTGPFVPGRAEDMTGQSVEEALDLSGLDITSVDFSGTVFHAPVTAVGTRFLGLAWFRGCRFLAGADFSGATFLSDARFDDAQFGRDVSFSRAEMRGTFVLDRATCEKALFLDRLQVLSNLSMDATSVAGPASLEGSEVMGGFWCNGARFLSRCNAAGMEVHGRTWVRGTSVADGQTRPSGPAGLLTQIHSYGYVWS